MNNSSETQNPAGQGRCYEIYLNYNCNAACKFCSQGSFNKSLNADFRDILRRILTGWKEGYKRLGFTGGEPLLYPEVGKIVAFSRAAGFRFIRMQTNGLKLADRRFAAELAGAGLTYCKFSIHSHKEEIHDGLVGVPGALRKVLAGLENVRNLKLRIGMNILITRENYADLSETLNFFLDRGVGDFVVIYPVYIGGMVKNFDSLGVSLPDAAPGFIESLDAADRAGVDLLFLNVPPCFVKGYEERVITGNFNTLVTDPTGKSWDIDKNRGEDKIYGKPCRSCLFKGRCRGADKTYIKYFGWKGFSPVKSEVHALSAKKTPAASAWKTYLTDNDRCFLEILGKENDISTGRVLEIAKTIPLCQDCRDGNAVMNSGEKLMKAGMIERRETKGVYYWRLNLK